MTPAFRLLQEGELLHREDEYYNYIIDRWEKIDPKHVGKEFHQDMDDHILVIRRRNPDFYYDHNRWI